MKRNPKADYNADQHVPYDNLGELDKEKDRLQVRIVKRLMSDNPRDRASSESDQDYKTRIANMFGSIAHEDWRTTHIAAKGNFPRLKDVTNSKGRKEQVDINVPWENLHSEWKAENLAAGYAAIAAVAGAASGGGGKKKTKAIKRGAAAASAGAATWVPLGRKVTTKDGERRALYRNSKTGEMRVKRMVTRNGRKVASYRKP